MEPSTTSHNRFSNQSTKQNRIEQNRKEQNSTEFVFERGARTNARRGTCVLCTSGHLLRTLPNDVIHALFRISVS